MTGKTSAEVLKAVEYLKKQHDKGCPTTATAVTKGPKPRFDLHRGTIINHIRKKRPELAYLINAPKGLF